MIKLTVPNATSSSQRIDLDGNGGEYLVTFNWVSRYQRFYLDISDSKGIPTISGLKLVPGAPVNLASLSEQGPQGILFVEGNNTKKEDLSTGESILY